MRTSKTGSVNHLQKEGNVAPRFPSSLFSMACMSNTNGLPLTAKEITFCQGLGTGRGRNTDWPDQAQCISNRARHEETKQNNRNTQMQDMKVLQIRGKKKIKPRWVSFLQRCVNLSTCFGYTFDLNVKTAKKMEYKKKYIYTHVHVQFLANSNTTI